MPFVCQEVWAEVRVRALPAAARLLPLNLGVPRVVYPADVVHPDSGIAAMLERTDECVHEVPLWEELLP